MAALPPSCCSPSWFLGCGCGVVEGVFVCVMGGLMREGGGGSLRPDHLRSAEQEEGSLPCEMFRVGFFPWERMVEGRRGLALYVQTSLDRQNKKVGGSPPPTPSQLLFSPGRGWLRGWGGRGSNVQTTFGRQNKKNVGGCPSQLLFRVGFIYLRRGWMRVIGFRVRVGWLINGGGGRSGGALRSNKLRSAEQEGGWVPSQLFRIGFLSAREGDG